LDRKRTTESGFCGTYHFYVPFYPQDKNTFLLSGLGGKWCGSTVRALPHDFNQPVVARFAKDKLKSSKRKRQAWPVSSFCIKARKTLFHDQVLEGKGVCGKTVMVFLHDLNQSAAAARFAMGKPGKLQKKETGMACLFLLELLM